MYESKLSNLMEYSYTPPVTPPSHVADRILDQLAAEGSPDVVTVILNGNVFHFDALRRKEW